MVSFVFYDLIFLGLFIIATVIFLSTRKHNLQRQGILYLYRTQLGVKYIDKFAKRFRKIMGPFQYVIILSGYLLMAGIIWLMVKTTYLYISTPIAQFIKAPPIAPLIPYFPTIFGLESFFPPLYFTYFLIALAIVAVFHEFAHGVYMRFYGMRIKSTGFAFLGPVLGAFVEQDEKQFVKSKKFPQLVVLAAGTFANILMTIFFGIIMIILFMNVFTPSGVIFNNYAYSVVNTSDVNVLGNSTIPGYLEVEVNGLNYFAEPNALQRSIDNNIQLAVVFESSPAFLAQLQPGSAITEIGGEKVTNREELGAILAKYEPGDNVTVKTAVLHPGRGTVAETFEEEVVLSEREGKTFLGITFIEGNGGGFIGYIQRAFTSIKDPFTLYQSSWGDFGWFVYYLLWWVVLINFFVALFNMLPLGILDGGRFFYLTIWGITRKESWGKNAYKIVTWFLIALFAIMMAKWFLGLF